MLQRKRGSYNPSPSTRAFDPLITGGRMEESADELGAIYALMERFEKQRLPRLLELKKRVDEGGVLSESDSKFMFQVTLDAQRSKRLIDRHPEWHEFCSEVIHLYEQISEKALDNERKL
jgi:hypothetical protein